MKYDVVLLTCGKPELTERCVASIVEHSSDYRLIWIDNAPNLSGVEFIAGKYNLWSLCDTNRLEQGLPVPCFEYLPMPENLGFVKATNVGLALATAPYVVLLNNDTEVPAGWLEKLEKGFEAFPGAAAVGPLSDEPAAASKGWQYQGHVQIRNKYIEVAHKTGVVGPMLAFFCTMISRQAIEKVGYLSEEFSPGFGDDDDWCARAIAAGLQLALATNLTVKHVHRATWPPEEVKKLQARNTEILLRKYGKQ